MIDRIEDITLKEGYAGFIEKYEDFEITENLGLNLKPELERCYVLAMEKATNTLQDNFEKEKNLKDQFEIDKPNEVYQI